MWHSELTFRCMPLVRAGYEDACIGAFLAWFHKGPGWYNVLDMELLPTGNRLHDAVVRHLGAASGLDWVEKRQESHIYECSSDFETYLSTNVSKEGRAALRRKHRNLAKLGPVEIIERGQADDMAAVADLFLRLEASGWKGKAGTAMASVPGQSETFRKLLTGGGEKGRVSVTELRVGGRPVAMLVTFLAAPGSFAFKIAYDQNHPAARQSPGVLLVMEAVRQMHEDGSLLGAGIQWCDSCAAEDSELDLRYRTRAFPLRCYRVAARHGFAALPILLQRLRALWTHPAKLVEIGAQFGAAIGQSVLV
ncbi:GNAT family N-acetyltransferase [Indioceanicola profundi]|uniref:GNAT family N-acetyltransferase n=1 Tax=Indioceanicola profundi TaxID=2220096 RepID=UPI00196909DC|nr:GNAT family N-acetyltransferase [Indioceanicola profundi]